MSIPDMDTGQGAPDPSSPGGGRPTVPGPAERSATSPYPPQQDEPSPPGPTTKLPRGSGTAAGSAAPRVALVAGAGSSLASVTNRLRHSRLRAAALFLAVTAAGLLVVGLLPGDPLWPLHTAVALFLGAAFVLLARRQPMSPLQLRVMEFTIFGLMAANMAVTHYHHMVDAAAREDAMRLQALVKNHLMGSMTLMFAYIILIPNAWRAAAGVAVMLASVPLLTEGVLFLDHPEVLRFAGLGGVEQAGVNVTVAVIAASLAIYGIYVLNTLRREVFEARRLNQYQLRQRLGSGGMGEVYLAEHRLLKRPCALKLIRPESAGDRLALARFEREVRSAARLSHPNIVEIYDYGHTDDGTFYYVMEYLRGLSLADLVENSGPLPAGRAIYLLGQACAALAEAHAAGLVHRDLKPANIFAAHVGRRYDLVKLLDFGLAKEVAAGPVGLTASGVIAGTPNYMAPEQALCSAPLDHRADLYALGGVAYYLLTGRPPFEAGSAFSVMMAHARDPVVPPSRVRPELPEDLERVVLRCLAKDPADRFPDAEAVAGALAACSAGGEWDARQAALWWQQIDQRGRIDPATRSPGNAKAV